MTGPEFVSAAIYTRVSLAAMGDTTKTDEQERLCRELCERRGWLVSEVFSDPSQSAWRRDRRRPGWDALLAAVRAGHVTGIATYWGDRLVRQPRDLEDLLDLRDVASVTVASVAGQYDFDNPDHRMMMRWEVARACNESDTISRRKKAQYERLRRAGLVRPGGGGGRALCFERDGVTHVPAEVAMVRDAAKAILAGQSVRSVLAALTEAGLRSTAGNVLSQSSFTRSLKSPRMAGLMPDGQSEAAWEPVLERAGWEALRAALAPGASVRRPGNGALHLLSGIAACGPCGHPLWIGYSGSGWYRCPPQGGGCGKVRRSRELLDAYVAAAVVTRLGRADAPAGRAPGSPLLAARYAALESQRREIEDILADPDRGSVPVLMRRLDGVNERIAQLRESAAGDASARLRRAHAGLTLAGFLALPQGEQRSLVSACFAIRVLPASRKGPGFRTEDVELTPMK